MDMNPHTFRLVLIASYLTLALFGIGYNRLIDLANQNPNMKGSTAFAVAFGNAVTILVMTVFFYSLALPFWLDMVLLGVSLLNVVRRNHARKCGLRIGR